MPIEDILNLIIKTVISFFFLLIILKIMGKREVGKLSTFDIVVFFVISELFSLSMNDPSASIFHSLIPVTIIVVLQLLSAFLSLKFPKIRKCMEGQLSYIIYRGEIQQDEMKKQRYNVEDLLIQLRTKDIQDPREVEFAILENNGVLNVIKKQDLKLEYPEPLVQDGKINQTALKRLNKKEDYVISNIQKKGYQKVEQIFLMLDLKGGFYVLPFKEKKNINSVK